MKLSSHLERSPRYLPCTQQLIDYLPRSPHRHPEPNQITNKKRETTHQRHNQQRLKADIIPGYCKKHGGGTQCDDRHQPGHHPLRKQDQGASFPLEPTKKRERIYYRQQFESSHCHPSKSYFPAQAIGEENPEGDERSTYLIKSCLSRVGNLAQQRSRQGDGHERHPAENCPHDINSVCVVGVGKEIDNVVVCEGMI